MRVLRSAALAALTLLLAAPLAAQDRMIIESETGVRFPALIGTPAGDSLVLMGTGVRTRTILKVKVYAFGLYVDPVGARAHLATFSGIPGYDLEKDEAFYDALLAVQFDMGLRLVMTRNVSADVMAGAFDDALRPRVEAAAREGSLSGGVAALDTFRGFFDVGELTEGSELLFLCDPAGTLHTRIKGEPAPTIDSPALCWALFDVYLGEDPISRDAKRGLILGFPNLLYRR